MLRKQYRVKRNLFSELKLLKPDTFYSNHLILKKFPPINNSPLRKFAVVVSKKNIKKACKRNKIKRIIYSLIRENNLLSGPPGVFVFFVKCNIEKILKEELLLEIKELLKN